MKRNSPNRVFAACALAAILAGTGCQTPPPVTPPPRRTAGLRTPPAPAGPQPGEGMFASTALEDLDDQEAVHYFARRKEGSLLVFVRGGHFLARPASLDGTPQGAKATDLGPAPTGAAELVVGSLRADESGYVLAWAEREGGRTKIRTLALDATGAARGERATLTESSDEVSWVDVLPRQGGSLVLWEVTRPQSSDVSGVALDAKGVATGPATSLLLGALGWHAAPNGTALVAVMPADTKDPASETGTVALGKVMFVRIDASGKARRQIEVSGSATAQPDVVIAEIGGKMVLAWTDMREVDAAVWTAVVDNTGAVVTPPKHATPRAGEQALVTAVGAENGASVERGLLAWEDVLGAPPESRQIHLASLGADGSIGKERATLAFHADGSPPDLAADAKGFGAITLAPAYKGASPPDDAPVWPTFVRFGPDLSVQSAEPVRSTTFGPDGVPYLVHGLTCNDGACATLATGGEAPSKIALVGLPSRKSEWTAPARRDADDAPPRVSAMAALYSGEQISRVAVTELGAGSALTAWVTYSPEGDPGAKAKRDGSAELTVLAVPPDAKAAALKPVQLSKKAVSVGGVGMSQAPGDKPEIALAWVAREKGESQVYVTKVDDTGKKLAQKKITVVPRAKKGGVASEASDVAIAWSSGEGGEGWIVSWVDTRDGNAEVYAAKIDRSLTKTVPDRRITDALGDAAEVHLLPRGKETLLTWSDARQKPDEGKGDIFVARIDSRTLAKVGAETRLAGTAAHSRSPQLTPGPGGAVWATWVEDGEGDAASAVRFASIDDKGIAATTTSLPAGADRLVVSATLACTDKACRGIVARSGDGALFLDAFDLAAGGQPGTPKTLLTLPGASVADISPVFADRAGTSLFFAADAASGLGRVRQMKIEW